MQKILGGVNVYSTEEVMKDEIRPSLGEGDKAVEKPASKRPITTIGGFDLIESIRRSGVGGNNCHSWDVFFRRPGGWCK